MRQNHEAGSGLQSFIGDDVRSFFLRGSGTLGADLSGAAPLRPFRGGGGPLTVGAFEFSKINDRGAMSIAMPASPYSRTKLQTFR